MKVSKVGEMIVSQVRAFTCTSVFDSCIVLPPKSPYNWISPTLRSKSVRSEIKVLLHIDDLLQLLVLVLFYARPF